MTTEQPSSSAIRVLVIGYGDIGSNVLRWLTLPPYKRRVAGSLLVRPSSLNATEPSKRAVLDGFVASGIKLVSGDVTDSVAQLVSIFRSFDVVVSTLGNETLSADTKLIEVARQSGLGLFIPSMFGFDYSAPGLDLILLPAGAKEAVAQQLIASGVGYVIISNGLFDSYLLSPFSGLDVERGVVHAPFSFDTRLTTTTLDTIGHCVAEVIVSKVKNERILLASDTVTFEQLAQAVEMATGKPLKRIVDSEVELRRQIAAEPDNSFPRYHLWWGLGKGMAWDPKESWNVRHGIPTTTIEVIAGKLDSKQGKQ